MKWSQTLIPTMKEVPDGAEIPSHILMLRAGMISQVMAGAYSYLPLGLRVLQKAVAIVREEINKTGAKAHTDHRADKDFFADLKATDNKQGQIHKHNKDTHAANSQNLVQNHSNAGNTTGIQVVACKEHIKPHGKNRAADCK